jgi:2-oxoglutarate ferredoxin oxidoreductase subunit alpha
MAEFVGLGYYTEIPAVIFDVQRCGPSTGLPTRTLQGDVQCAANLSHGDTQHICLYPANMLECYQHAQDAFDLAEKFQTPVLVLSDLDLGMNNWVSERFPYPDKPIQRGKVLNEKQLDELRAAGKTFERYRDVDGDGIPYRTLPGTDHPMGAYFTRGSGHNEKAHYSEKPEDWVRNLDRLAKKFDTARKFVPAPVFSGDESAEVGLIAYGSTNEPMQEVIDQLRAQGVRTHYMRIRAFPFTQSVHDFIQSKKRVYVIEQNRDGQMLKLLKCDIAAEQVVKLRSVRSYDGLPVAARTVSDAIFEKEMA